jgi:tellurium resistance protein TerZ
MENEKIEIDQINFTKSKKVDEINLLKGQKIDIKKHSSDSSLEHVCLGLNWGMIEKKGFFGGIKKKEVDLDGSCAVFDVNKELIDIVYFGNLTSQNGSIRHSGDDTVGSKDNDDSFDNEIIYVDLKSLPSNADQIIFILNSPQGHDFADIPFTTARLYEGNFETVDKVIAKFDVANNPKFKGYVSMVMGKLHKRNGEWGFSAIGEPTRDKKLKDTIKTSYKYL